MVTTAMGILGSSHIKTHAYVPIVEMQIEISSAFAFKTIVHPVN